MTVANASASFGTIQQRFNDLIGETNSSTASDAGKRHINAVIQEIVGNYPFSWNVKNTTLTLSSYKQTLPVDYFPGWPMEYVAVPATTSSAAIVFTQIPVSEIVNYTTDDTSSPVFWISYDSVNDIYTLNSNITGVTLTVYYHYSIPTLVNLTDACPITDPELVAYGAAAKNWIGDERNVQLQQNYAQVYNNGVKALWIADLQNNVDYTVGGIAGQQVNWTQ